MGVRHNHYNRNIHGIYTKPQLNKFYNTKLPLLHSIQKKKKKKKNQQKKVLLKDKGADVTARGLCT